MTETLIKAISKSVKYYHDIPYIHSRTESIAFGCNDFYIGIPVYAGRTPKIVETFMTNIRGDKTPAVIIGVY